MSKAFCDSVAVHEYDSFDRIGENPFDPSSEVVISHRDMNKEQRMDMIEGVSNRNQARRFESKRHQTCIIQSRDEISDMLFIKGRTFEGNFLRF